MTQRLFLHVGVPKSGTTYLQRVLETNRETLAAAGVLVVGRTVGERVHAAMGVRQDPRLQTLPPRAATAWPRLVEQVRAWAGPEAVLSYELFAGATEEQATAALADLRQVEGLEVHVVVTARDLGAVVPSAWQERLKFGLTTPLASWEPFPESRFPAGDWGWLTLDPSGVAARWGATLPPERVHIVTVPRRGAATDELWRRFAEATMLDRVGVPALELDVERTNESLGAPAAEVLRRVNEAVGDRLPTNRDHALWLRDTLAHAVLVPQGAERIGLTDAQFEVTEKRSARCVRRLRKAGYAVHGDLDDIRATRPEGRSPEDVSEGDLLASAVDAVVQLLLSLRERTAERDDLQATAARSRRVEVPAAPEPSPRGLERVRTTGRRLVRDGAAGLLERKTTSLEARVGALEAHLQDYRRLQRRAAELTDLVTELLLPAAERNEAVTEALVRAYREESL